jgi:hypothetical protein
MWSFFIQLPQINQDKIIFDAEGDFSSGKIKFMGSAKDSSRTVGLPVGVSGVNITSLAIEVDVQWGTGTTPTGVLLGGMLKGNILFPGASLQAEIDLAAATASLTVSAILVEDHPIPLATLVTSLCGPNEMSSIPLPASLLSAIENVWSFNSLQVEIKTSPPLFAATGVMSLFGSSNLRAMFEMGFSSSGNWVFTFAVQLGSNTKFSEIFSAIHVLDSMNLASPALAVTSLAAQDFNFPGANLSYHVEYGFNFLASLNLEGSSGFEAIKKWTGIDQVSIRGVIASEDQFSLHADLQGNLQIFRQIDVTAAGLDINVTPTEAQVGVECDALVTLSTRPTDQLQFHGDFFIGTAGLGFEVAMTNDWVNPLGVTGVTISRTDLSLEESWALVPNQVGLAGGLHVGNVGGNAAIWINEEYQMLYGELDNIQLNQIIDDMLGDFGITKPPALVQTLTDISLQSAKLYANTAPTPVVFFGNTYAPGYEFSVQQLNLWGIIKGSADIRVGG